MDLITAEALSAPLQKEKTAEICFRWPQSLSAGFEKGDVVGSAALLVNGQQLASVPLIAAEGVAERSFQYGARRAAELWLLLAE